MYAAGMATICWNTVPGKTHSLYCADGFAGAALSWRRIIRGIEGTGDEFFWTDGGAPEVAPSNAAGVNMRFYRLAIQ